MPITGSDTIHEMDGPLMGFLLYGDDIDLDEIEQFLDAEVDEHYDAPAPEGGWEITECYVRKVPTTDGDGARWMSYHYQAEPARGAKKCVRVEAHSSWGHWCHNHIYEPAVTGKPLETFNPTDIIWPFVSVRITPPEQRRAHARGPQDDVAYLYFCRPCARKIDARIDIARAEHMAEYHRARGEESYAARCEERARAAADLLATYEAMEDAA